MSASSTSTSLPVSRLFGRPFDHKTSARIPINLIKLNGENSRPLLPWIALSSHDNIEGDTTPGFRAVVPCDEWAQANTAMIFRLPAGIDGEVLTVKKIFGDVPFGEALPDDLAATAATVDAYIMQLGKCFTGSSFMVRISHALFWTSLS